MDSNPYSPPETEDLDSASAAKIQYRVFTVKAVSFKLSMASSRDEVRKQAQWAIEHEIGVANVVSILENPPQFLNNFEIVVWYRTA